MVRLGRVVFDLGYIVNLDDAEMIDAAETAIIEDIHNALRHGEIEQYLEVRPDADATENDIPEFLKDNANERDTRAS